MRAGLAPVYAVFAVSCTWLWSLRSRLELRAKLGCKLELFMSTRVFGRGVRRAGLAVMWSRHSGVQPCAHNSWIRSGAATAITTLTPRR